MKHAVLVNSKLSGFEYGMLNDFQDEIIDLTGAVPFQAPENGRFSALERKVGHGGHYAFLRPLLRRSGLSLSTDVLWVPMMGPENWPLDLYRKWDSHVGFKILYLFDTMERHVPSIRRVLNSTKWDVTITSFSGALPLLEAETGRKWFAVPQGVKLSRFRPSHDDLRLIDVCSYGRRLGRVHNSLIDLCQNNGWHYEYTTATGLAAGTNPTEHYRQYAWHLRHTIFNVCWPVEMTNPQRVRTFSPITCRWFEAAASGNVIVGRPPSDLGFEELFGPESVISVNPDLPNPDLRDFFESLWENRAHHLQVARRRHETNSHKWSWRTRVREIERLAGLAHDAPADVPVTRAAGVGSKAI
jgi:hypothetical protein